MASSDRIAAHRASPLSDAQRCATRAPEWRGTTNESKQTKDDEGKFYQNMQRSPPQKLIVGSTCESGESMASHSSSVTHDHSLTDDSDESVTSLTTHAHECQCVVFLLDQGSIRPSHYYGVPVLVLPVP
jgi:hypothetical protein